MTSDELRALIEAIEAADEPTRELSDRVLLACGFTRTSQSSMKIGGIICEVHDDSAPSPLSSLEDAKLAVPERCNLRQHDISEQSPPCIVKVGIATAKGNWKRDATWIGLSDSEPRALVLAGLRARLAEMEHGNAV